MPADRQTDEHNRVIFSDREVPDPWSPESRFAQWRGKTCGPWTVITVTEQRHRQVCRNGWTDIGRWWFVCGRCHPTAVDMPGTSSHQGGPPARTKDAHTVDVGHVHVLAEPGGSCAPGCPHPDHRTKETTDE